MRHAEVGGVAWQDIVDKSVAKFVPDSSTLRSRPVACPECTQQRSKAQWHNPQWDARSPISQVHVSGIYYAASHAWTSLWPKPWLAKQKDPFDALYVGMLKCPQRQQYRAGKYSLSPQRQYRMATVLGHHGLDYVWC